MRYHHSTNGYLEGGVLEGLNVALGTELRKRREGKGFSIEQIENKFLLGPGWVHKFESGIEEIPIEILTCLTSTYEVSMAELFASIKIPDELQDFPRTVYALKKNNGISIKFPYAKHDAEYFLDNATEEEFKEVILELTNGLALSKDESEESGQIKTNAVVNSYFKAVNLWPSANPSDIWYFLIYRAFCDRYNHPAEFSRLDFGQSWKRTGGWALEEILVRHYGQFLEEHNIRVFIASKEEKDNISNQLKVKTRLETDKIDVWLTGNINGREYCFGIVHVKASIAERRTDDVPMSSSLIESGYTSVFWTMDCKSMPSSNPYNKGEFGNVRSSGGKRLSAKRRDFEDDNYFSACFSYNKNTIPTDLLPNLSSFIS